MILRNYAFAAAATLLIATPIMADDDFKHYKGEAANTLEQAVVLFSEYNTKLETVLAGELTPKTMSEIHQLTYTLENALEKIEDEMDELADTLERVHKASEVSDTGTVLSAGRQYLETSREIIK